MKTLPKAIGTFVLILFGTLASGAAMAQHHGHGGGVRFGISLGFPVFGPGYYPAPYYAYPYAYPAYGYPAPAYAYPPAVMGSYASPAYAEQGMPQAAPAPSQAQGDWYYCAASATYYPYAKECPAGWQRVPAQPSSR
jgi:hypothetical protein